MCKTFPKMIAAIQTTIDEIGAASKCAGKLGSRASERNLENMQNDFQRFLHNIKGHQAYLDQENFKRYFEQVENEGK